MRTFQAEIKPFMVKRPNGEELEVRAIIVSREEGMGWRPSGEIRPHPGGGAVINVSIPQGMDPTKQSVQDHIRSVLIHEMAHAAEPQIVASLGTKGMTGRSYVNHPSEVTARVAEVVHELRTPKAQSRIYWDDELPAFSTTPMEWARSSSKKWEEIAPLLDEPAKRRFMRAIAAAYEDARPPAPPAPPTLRKKAAR